MYGLVKHQEKLTNSICPSCRAADIIKYGKSEQGHQVYKCKPCNKKFTDNGAMPGRKIGARIVGDAIGAFYDGLSYRDIQRRIEALHDFKPSTATIYEWVLGYTDHARELASEHQPRVGAVWVADEMVIKTDGRKLWLWSVMDRDTRFLLAMHLSAARTMDDTVSLFKRAGKRAGIAPRMIVTDGMNSYPDGIERVFGADTRHVVAEGIHSPLNNNLVERLNGTIRERIKVMRGLETPQTAQRLLDGFMLHYNWVKPHEGLKGRTPAQAAGMPNLFNDWVDVSHMQVRESERARKMRANPMRVRRMPRRRR
jgi:transposase-like protein/predicted RNA-binding Zn-ribbon protein involved in translation (DUF1610 family)